MQIRAGLFGYKGPMGGLQYSDRPLYGNCLVRNPIGDAIFRCDLRKMKWYLSRDLAEQVQDSPPVIQLRFQPNGLGHLGDPFFLTPRKNRCVVCGTDERLTRHHVVPRCYRRYFPEDYRRYGSYDVFAICVEHHEEYEDTVETYREVLVKEYGAPAGGIGGRAEPTIGRAISAAWALVRHKDKMPAWRIAELERIVKHEFGQELTEKDLRDIMWRNRWVGKSHGRLVMEQVNGCYERLNAFMVRWRKHFVETMDPQFLPEHWEPERYFYPE